MVYFCVYFFIFFDKIVYTSALLDCPNSYVKHLLRNIKEEFEIFDLLRLRGNTVTKQPLEWQPRIIYGVLGAKPLGERVGRAWPNRPLDTWPSGLSVHGLL